MAKSKEKDSIGVTNSKGVTTTKVVDTVVKDGKLVADDSSQDLGVRQ